MKHTLWLVQIGSGARLSRALGVALGGLVVKTLAPEQLETDGQGKRLLFAVHVDACGTDEQFCRTLRALRAAADCLMGSVAGMVIDGDGELYTKEAARQLALSANQSGCLFPGKPLVEGTGSLYNQHILARQWGLDWEQTYVRQIQMLAARIAEFEPPVFRQPRLLMLHASDHTRSNTLWLGHEILSRLPQSINAQEISLQNGAIYDCRGCSYEACRHFAENQTCFYGGAISKRVLPAIEQSDALLFLCPNYNDAVSANIMALFNRLTNFLVRQDLMQKYLFGVVVSGYSGSDLVAMQLLGAMCLNKSAILPPHFCMMQTANDPGAAEKIAGIDARLDRFTAGIASVAARQGA